MRKVFLQLTIGMVMLLIPVAAWVGYTRQAARLDLTNNDDLYTAGKFIGLVPVSKIIYAEGIGFIDQTIIYQALVTPDEVAWLAQVPEVTQFEAPHYAPLWWKISFWWNGWNSDMKYFRTKEKWPCIFAYSKRRGVIYGTANVGE